VLGLGLVQRDEFCPKQDERDEFCPNIFLDQIHPVRPVRPILDKIRPIGLTLTLTFIAHYLNYI